MLLYTLTIHTHIDTTSILPHNSHQSYISHITCHRLFITTTYYPHKHTHTHTSLLLYPVPHNPHSMKFNNFFHPKDTFLLQHLISHLCHPANIHIRYPHNSHICHPHTTYIRVPNVVNICATLFNIKLNISWNNEVQICWLEKWVELWVVDTYQSFLEGNVLHFITNETNWIQIDPLCQWLTININLHGYNYLHVYIQSLVVNLHGYSNNLLYKFDWRVWAEQQKVQNDFRCLWQSPSIE